MANKDAKAAIVEEIKANIQKSASVVMIDYMGITVAQDNVLRAKMREAGVVYKIYKNTLIEKAFKELGFDGMDGKFAGPTSVAFGIEDAVAPAKVANDFAKTCDKVELKFGYMDGKVLSKAEVTTLASTPSKQELYGMLASGLSGVIRNFAYAIKAIADKKGEEPAA